MVKLSAGSVHLSNVWGKDDMVSALVRTAYKTGFNCLGGVDSFR